MKILQKILIAIFVLFTPNNSYAKDKKNNYDPNFTYFTVGAGPASGMYFAFASALASTLTRPQGSPPCRNGGSCGVENMIAITHATEGSRQNLKQLLNGKIDSALLQANDLLENKKDLRVIATLYPEYLHAVVRGHSSLHKFLDIKNKKISMGPEMSGSAHLMKPILSALGLAKWEYKIAADELGQSCDALSQKDVEALLYFGGGPLPSINKMAKCEQIRLLNLTPKQQHRLTARFPFLENAEIPSGLYWGVAPTSTVAVYAKWVTRKDMPADKIYKITKSFYHPKNQKFLNANFPQLNLLSAHQSLKHSGQHLHPGAFTYYQEHQKK